MSEDTSAGTVSIEGSFSPPKPLAMGKIKFALTARGSIDADQAPPEAGAAGTESLPTEGVSMPWVGHGKEHTERGYLRDYTYFWRERARQGGMGLESGGRAPAGMEHHHVGQGSYTVPLPWETHRKDMSSLHPEEEILGRPEMSAEEVSKRVDSAREAQAERAGKWGGERPPVTPQSEVAAVPPDERRPIDPTSTAGAVEGGRPEVKRPKAFTTHWWATNKVKDLKVVGEEKTGALAAALAALREKLSEHPDATIRVVVHLAHPSKEARAFVEREVKSISPRLHVDWT
jgi:hypothetical protein